MAALITTLIDKDDTNQIVRDKIAVILALEIANQRALAVLASKPNPDDWFFNVFIERSRPWEIETENDGTEGGQLPLVNVFYDNDVFDNKNSNVVEKQRTKGTFFVDCYGFKSRTAVDAGDELSSYEADRIAKLVRNILMAAVYTYLDLRTLVTKRYITRREKFQPDIRQDGFENIVGARITIEVEYDETSPQAVADDLEEIFSEVKLSETGQVLFDQLVDTT